MSIKQVFPSPPDYYKNYTDENVNSDLCQPPNSVSKNDFTVFGIKDNVKLKLWNFKWITSKINRLKEN